MSTTSKSLRQNILVLFSSLFLLAIIAEVLLRFLGMANPILYDTSSSFGYAPKPNQSSTRLGVPVFINDVGLRDNEDYEAMDGKKKILIIGDSVTYGGSRTRQKDLFSEVLETKLIKQDPNIKVLNAGVNGYSVCQMFRRAKHLMQKIDPDKVIVYTIRRDFFRPPVSFIREGNIIYPTKKPKSALLEFLFLSINHLNKRFYFFDMLPSRVASWLKPPMNFATPFDKSRVLELNFEAIEDFLENVWDSSGRRREQIMVFVAPERSEVVENSSSQNSDLSSRFDSLGIACHDLQNDFFEAIVAKGQKIEDYYWDDIHYVEQGHFLVAEILSSYIFANRKNLPLP